MSNTKHPVNFVDLKGRRFGRLTVLVRAPSSSNGRARWEPRWECRCDCGSLTQVTSHALVQGHTKSCGCRRTEVSGHCNRTHGQTVGGNTRLYRCWRDVVNRCTNPNVQCYARYGGAGVTICDEWRHSFARFALDVGAPPDTSLTIDRIDNSRGYEPGNVRWATSTQQARNRRYCKLSIDRAGEMRRLHSVGASYRELAEQFGCAKSTVAMCCNGRTWA